MINSIYITHNWNSFHIPNFPQNSPYVVIYYPVWLDYTETVLVLEDKLYNLFFLLVVKY